MRGTFFCGKCGRMLTAFEGRSEQDVVCSCGHVQKLVGTLSAGEKMQSTETLGKGILKLQKTKGFPHTCKKCGYGKCEPTQIGASYSDESDICLYKCLKCGFTERQADGTGNK